MVQPWGFTPSGQRYALAEGARYLSQHCGVPRNNVAPRVPPGGGSMTDQRDATQPGKPERQQRQRPFEQAIEVPVGDTIQKTQSEAGTDQARTDHQHDQGQPLMEEKPCHAEDERLGQMLRDHAGREGRHLGVTLAAALLDEACDQWAAGPDQTRKERRDGTGDQGACAAQSPLGQRRPPAGEQHEQRNGKLQHPFRQADQHPGCHQRTQRHTRQKGQQTAHVDMAPCHRHTPAVGPKLYHPMLEGPLDIIDIRRLVAAFLRKFLIVRTKKIIYKNQRLI